MQLLVEFVASITRPDQCPLKGQKGDEPIGRYAGRCLDGEGQLGGKQFTYTRLPHDGSNAHTVSAHCNVIG